MTALALTVLLMAPPATSLAVTTECELRDNGCKARRYEQKAEAAPIPRHRAKYLYSASRSYFFHYGDSKAVDDLCAARRTLDASLAIEDQPANLRAQSETWRGELLDRVARAGAHCGDTTPSRRPVKDAHRVTRRRTHEPAAPPATPTLDAESAMPAQPGQPADLPRDKPTPPAVSPRPSDADPTPLMVAEWAMPVQPSQPADLLPVVRTRLTGAVSPGSGSGAPADDTRPVRLARRLLPGQGLMIAGGVTLGVGVALAAAAGVMGHRLLETRREAAALGSMVDSFASDDQLERDAGLIRDYERLGPQTLALAFSSGVTVVVAAVLLGVGGRRMTRVASRTAVLPTIGGLVLRARF